MRFGLFYVMHRPENSGLSEADVYQTQVGHMVAADDLGYDSVWIAEHHFSNVGVCSAPQVLGALIAGRTRRIRIGMGIVLLALHDPVQVAEELAVLDHASGGRLDVGIGRASSDHEYRGFNIPFAESRQRIDEGLEILRGVWTQDPFAYEGTFRRVTPVSLVPKPLQKPHPPLYLACNSADSVPVAARHGLPMSSAFLVLDDALNERAEVYRQVSAEAGHSAAEVEARLAETWNVRWVYVNEDERAARNDPREHVFGYLQTVRSHGSGVLPPIDVTDSGYDAYLESGAAFFGTPAQVAERIARFHETTGLNKLLCFMGVGAMDPGKVRRSMELFAGKVMPQFQETPVPA